MRHTLSDLKQDPRNARRHSDRNIETIALSIRDNGFGRPMLIDNENTIIAGNATAIAAGQAGLDDVLVIESDGTRPIAIKRTDVAPGSPEFHRLSVGDNRSAEFAEWDPAILQELAGEVDLSPYFNDDELQALIAGVTQTTDGLTDPDDVPDPPKEPITKPGDLWQLGQHRLLCGDATVVTDVDRLMGGEKADMVWSDPPYGMDLDTDFSGEKSSRRMLKDKGLKGGRKYDCVVGDADDFDPSFILSYFASTNEIFLWGADYYAERLPSKNEGSWLVWDKRLDESADRMYGSSFELCWSKSRHRREIIRIKWAGVFGTEQEFDRKRHHPTQKPIDLAQWFIEKHSDGDDLIVDLYLGSGTALIAAEETGRRCFGMEISPAYVDVAVTRWQNFTGQPATLVTDLAQAAD